MIPAHPARARLGLLALTLAATLLAPSLSAQDKAKAELPIIATPVGERKASDKVGPIVMGNMPALQALDMLRDFSGRVVIPAEGLPSPRLNFNSGGQLRRDEAIYAIENILAMNGIALMRLDNDFIRAVSGRDVARRAPEILDQLPTGAQSEQVFGKIYRLEHIDSTTALAPVRAIVSPGNRSSVLNYTLSNSLFVIDSLSNLQQIDKLLRQLDQPPEVRAELYTFPVRHGSAWNIRATFLQLYRTELNNRLSNSLVWVDSRTNKLLVVTQPANLPFFQSTIEELDQEVAPFTTSKIIRINEGNYWTIWGIINGIVRNQQREYARQSFRSREVTTDPSGARQLTIQGETLDLETTDEEGVITALVQATADSDPAALMMDSGMPELQFSPYISLFADASNYAYVVYGTQADIARMEKLITSLDVKSAPYVASEVFSIKFADAQDITNIINTTIWVQRRAFHSQGIASGRTGARDNLPAPEAGSQGFEFSDFVAIIADRRNNSVLAYGTRQDIEQVQDLIKKLDIESAPVTRNTVIYLEHAEASTLARVVQNIINFQRSRFAANRARSQARENATGDAFTPVDSTGSAGFEFSEYAVVNADRRTNALFVYGTERDIIRVRELVEEADIPVEPITSTKVFLLQHTDANQTAGIINRVISGQQRALRQVLSQSREIANPATQAQQQADPVATAVVEGQESLQFSPFITITPDTRSNSLIVYGTGSDITQIDKLLTQIDIEVAPYTDSEIFLLENAQASALASILNSIVNGQERALRRVRSRIQEIRNIRPGDEETTTAEATLQALQFSPYVTITPNTRNNSLIVYGSTSDIQQLRNLITISDTKIAPRTQSQTFFIRHANAVDVARTISTLINQQQRVREREATFRRVFRRDGEDEGGRADGQIGMGLETFAGDEAPMRDMIEETSTSTYAAFSGLDDDLQFSPYVSLVADSRSNSVLAYGTPFDLEQVGILIAKIDDVLPQVRIEVVIAEVLLTGRQVSGFESFGLEYNLTNPNQIRTRTTAPRLPGTPEPAFDMGLALNDFSLDTVFRVAQEDSNVKVLSAPSITTTHNRQAVINVGEARPIITSTASNLGSSDLVTRSTVEYRDIGITLRVRPLVSEHGHIQMDLEQVVETVISTQEIDRNEQPIISTRRASSFVSVQDQEVIVMGGLQQVESRDRDGKVFILGDIPILGQLFQPQTNEQSVRELIIFIKPYIVDTSRESQQLTREELERTAIGEDIEHYLDYGRFREQEQLIPPAPTAEAAREDLEQTTQTTAQATTPAPGHDGTTDATPAAHRSSQATLRYNPAPEPSPPANLPAATSIPRGPRR